MLPIPSQIRGTVRLIPDGAHAAARSSWTRAAAIAGGRSPPRPGRGRAEQPGPALVRRRLSRHQCRRRSLWRTPSRPGTGARASTRKGAAMLYDVERRSGAALALALRSTAPARSSSSNRRRSPLCRTTRWWRVARRTRADASHPATVRETLEDAPFYARSVLPPTSAGRASHGRAREPVARPLPHSWVQALLPFRMPRVP